MHIGGSDADIAKRRRLECADIAFVLSAVLSLGIGAYEWIYASAGVG